MAIDIRTFGSKKPSATAAKSDDRPKAQFWVNFGYVSDVMEEDGSGYRFVSLSMGIPLDTLETLPTNFRNKSHAFFNVARNELRDDLIEAAQKLAPGEDIIGSMLEVEARQEAGDTDYNGRNVLTYQIRRVNEEQAAPTGENPFSRKG